jgi:hypothetical protein
MPNLLYLIPRLIRHYLPDRVVRVLLERSLIIHPGLETSKPETAVQRYLQMLALKGVTIGGKRVMVFGYGGSYAVGCGLLHAGAGHVVLCERAGFPESSRNARLLPQYGEYLGTTGGNVTPNPAYFTRVHGDIRQVAGQKLTESVDLVLSSSVFEHLDDLKGITSALVSLTAPGGAHLHFIDLRDHYFRYPFEMLCYSEHTWQRWLNPGSNLNRRRLPDYRGLFEDFFNKVDIEIQTSDPLRFERARPRILPEFLTGDAEIDSVTKITVAAYL